MVDYENERNKSTKVFTNMSLKCEHGHDVVSTLSTLGHPTSN